MKFAKSTSGKENIDYDGRQIEKPIWSLQRAIIQSAVRPLPTESDQTAQRGAKGRRKKAPSVGRTDDGHTDSRSRTDGGESALAGEKAGRDGRRKRRRE